MPTEQQRLDFLVKAHEAEDIYMEVDGFYYFEPNGAGHFNAHQLRWIADELDRMNAAWQKDMDEYFTRDTKDD